MKHRIWGLLLLLFLVLGICAACTEAAPTPSGEEETPEVVLKIGFIGPLTGANAAEGSAARNAFELAIEQANGAGKLPYTLQLVAMDDESKSDSAAAAAQRLSADKAVVAIGGFWNNSCAQAAIPICQKAETPLLIWGANGLGLTSADNNPVVSRICPTLAQESAILGKLTPSLGVSQAFILSDASVASQANASSFQESFQNSGGVVVGSQEVAAGTSDFSAIITAMRESGADLIFFAGSVQDAALCKQQMIEMGFNEPICCGTSELTTAGFAQAAGEAAANTVSLQPGFSYEASQAGQAFLENYAAKNYNVPVGQATMYAYDAAQTILTALRQWEGEEPPTAADLTPIIRRVQFEGLSGTIAFDTVGQNTNDTGSLLIYSDGTWTPWQKTTDADNAAETVVE